MKYNDIKENFDKNAYDQEDYFVVRKQSKRDLENNTPSKFWDQVSRHDSLGDAQQTIEKLRQQSPNDKFSYTMHRRTQGVAEAGPFSYGAKKPKKGSVADLAAKKRKEQERGQKPVEPRDQMVGTARVTKDVAENAEELNIGDDVIITGNVQFQGKTGMIVDFGDMKRFVIVDLYNHGKHSFHSSDVSYNDYADSDDERRDSMSEARANTAGARAGLAKRKTTAPLSPEEQIAKDRAKFEKWKAKNQKPEKDTTTGVSEDAAGVGVIASKKQKNDPRYSMSLTKDVRPGEDKRNMKKLHLEGYGRNRGYSHGFASPTAPSLGRRGREDDEYVNGPDPVDTATWYIRANGKIIKDKMGTPFQFRGKEAARKAAMTMMAKPFNAGKKFVLTTRPEDEQPVAEAGKGISKDAETKFHAKLDQLVHDTFGKRKSEKK